MPTRSAAPDARTRMLRSAADLQRMTGVVGTGFSEIIARSGAPRGSIYHHFPDGRMQLAAEATAYAAQEMADALRPILAEGSLHDALDKFIALWVDLMQAGEFHIGCAVAAAALDSRSAPALRQAADDGFELWLGLLVEAIGARGVAGPAARQLATMILASVEGGIILARAAGDATPLESVRDTLHHVIDAMSA